MAASSLYTVAPATRRPSESDRSGKGQSRGAQPCAVSVIVGADRRAEDGQQPRFSTRGRFVGGLSPLFRPRHPFSQAGEVLERTLPKGRTWAHAMLSRRPVACCTLLGPATISGIGLYPQLESLSKSPLTWTPIPSLAPNFRRSLSKRSS